MSMGIEPIAAPNPVQAADTRQRSAAAFGAAVTYRDIVQEQLRVDPAAVVARMQTPEKPRPEQTRPSVRQQRFAEEEAAYDARRDARLGAHVDIEV
jgi:hypothetical protein